MGASATRSTGDWRASCRVCRARICLGEALRSVGRELWGEGSFGEGAEALEGRVRRSQGILGVRIADSWAGREGGCWILLLLVLLDHRQRLRLAAADVVPLMVAWDWRVLSRR